MLRKIKMINRTKKEKAARGALFLFLLCFGVIGHAQSDPYDPNSPNYIGKRARAPKFNAQLSAMGFRSPDEFSDTGMYYEGYLGFSLTEKLKGGVIAGYSHPTDFDAQNPKRWRFEDVQFRLIHPSYWTSKDKKARLNLSASLSAPTSGTSINAGMITSGQLAAQYVYSLGKVSLSLTPGITAAYHEYETQDEDGFIKNSPLGFTAGGSLRYQVFSKLGAVVGASLYNYFDYDFTNYNIQTYRASIDYSPTNKIILMVGTRWRNRVISNNSLFDEDAFIYYLNVTYTL